MWEFIFSLCFLEESNKWQKALFVAGAVCFVPPAGWILFCMISQGVTYCEALDCLPRWMVYVLLPAALFAVYVLRCVIIWCVLGVGSLVLGCASGCAKAGRSFTKGANKCALAARSKGARWYEWLVSAAAVPVLRLVLVAALLLIALCLVVIACVLVF